MDIAGKARKLERRITRTVDAAVEEFIGRSEPAPIEVVHAVLDRAEQQIQEIGRGRRVFPFNRVRLHVVAGPGQKEKRARFEAVVDGPPSLCERLVDRLRSAGCATTDLSAEVVYARHRGGDWAEDGFHVEFERVSIPARAERVPEPPLPAAATAGEITRMKVAVVKGTAEQPAYVFSGSRVDIGRGSEVVDKRQHLVRTNHVVFSEDGGEINSSVSRRHAHIDRSADGRSYRLWDDKSAHGTNIIRKGRTIRVPAAVSRGTRLESGDEIVLGQARLRVTFEPKK
jgi:hypothetical protein